MGRLLTQSLTEQGIKVSEYTGRINDADSIKNWISDKHIKIIIHLAAIVSIEKFNKDIGQSLKVNCLGTYTLADLLIKYRNDIKFIMISTSHVYKPKKINDDYLKIKEEDPLEPSTTYGHSKLIAEKIVSELYKSNEEKLIILRIFSLYHESFSDDFLVNNLVKKIKETENGQKIQIPGGNNIRDLSYLPTIVKKINKIAFSKNHGLYNLGSGEGYALSQIAEIISRKIFNKKIEIEFLDNQSSDVVIADVSKSNRILDS
jgi:nucleoside-diphosphate-sugar epimerase